MRYTGTPPDRYPNDGWGAIWQTILYVGLHNIVQTALSESPVSAIVQSGDKLFVDLLNYSTLSTVFEETQQFDTVYMRTRYSLRQYATLTYLQ